MRKPIFESEEEFEEFFLDMRAVCMGKDKQRARELGYIRRLPVEEAEEMYKNWMTDCDHSPHYTTVMKTMKEAIDYLKKQLEEKDK